MERFFTGLHQPSDAQHFNAAFISVVRLRSRKGPFQVGDWIMDSGAFSELDRDQDKDEYGNLLPNDYRWPVEEYAGQIIRWAKNGNLLAAVSQDYMCEKRITDKTCMDVGQHQIHTIRRYDGLVSCKTGVYIMPVLQGYRPEDYVRHLRMYGERLTRGMWVGVGSVCKRNGNIKAIEEVFLAIHHERPDLRLHGFGLKKTALSSGLVQELIWSADSMAWSFQARMEGRNGNDWKEAKRWTARIENREIQMPLFIPPKQEATS